MGQINTNEQNALRPLAGMGITLDAGAQGNLLPCDDWDAAEFRMDMWNTRLQLGVNVEITGRKDHAVASWSMQRKVRVRVTFVGDGEPDEEALGWMFYDPRALVRWNDGRIEYDPSRAEA